MRSFIYRDSTLSFEKQGIFKRWRSIAENIKGTYISGEEEKKVHSNVILWENYLSFLFVQFCKFQ